MPAPPFSLTRLIWVHLAMSSKTKSSRPPRGSKSAHGSKNTYFSGTRAILPSTTQERNQTPSPLRMHPHVSDGTVHCTTILNARVQKSHRRRLQYQYRANWRVRYSQTSGTAEHPPQRHSRCLVAHTGVLPVLCDLLTLPRGGFSIVRLAEEKKSRTQFAVKCVKKKKMGKEVGFISVG